MISAMVLSIVLALASEGLVQEDPLARDPAQLPVASAERWEGLFENRELVREKLPMELAPLVGRAREAYARSDYPAAMTTLFELLELEPDFPPSLLELGTIYFRLRRYGDAVVCFERFLKVAPGQVWRTQGLAHSYYSLGRHETARAHYERVLDILPDSVEAVRGLSLAHYRLGNPERALELLDRVISLRAEHAEAFVWKAQILYEEERSTEALTAVNRARDIDRFQPKPWYLLWQIHLDLGNLEEAEAAHREWVDLDRLVQQVRSVEGRLLFNPADYRLALRLSELQREIGNLPATREALARAVRNRPSEVPELQLLIHVLDTLFDLGDTQGAAQAAAQLGRSCAAEPEAWKRLEVYYARVGNADMQVRAGELYLRLSREQ